MTVEKDYTFNRSDDYQECPVCGISSFSHHHRAGTLPRDFDRIPDEEDLRTAEIGIDPALIKDETALTVFMKFGSDFQRDVYLPLVVSFLQAIQGQMVQANKKNELSFTVEKDVSSLFKQHKRHEKN